ncbi:MAG: enoyl-CoA hydratase-related protein [Dehalococcoidia bacterium]|nr:enoyl-CoA hydratase/isomerase family protein [Dehalococcoidia bacterium]MCB9485883.1 enoyl-CoA hydratase/isomerase family protein [Thermoflexaceae bacterium]
MVEREKDVVLYRTEGAIARITLNRPKYRNAQSYHLLDELDGALERAMADREVAVVILEGAGGNFSSGHDLGTPESVADREARGLPESGIEFYDAFKHYNLDITLKWRNMPKPTIAMVDGFCIFGGWMIAASMDLVFASDRALFLPALLEYPSVPWDITPKKAKELCFESRFLTAVQALEAGFVNRVCVPEALEQETVNYALRVAENDRMIVRMTKLSINKAQDLMGYANGMEAGFGDYVVMMRNQGGPRGPEGVRRLGPVDLALRGLRGQRTGLEAKA